LRNGSKKIALLLLLALLVSSFSFSQEKKYYITESQLIELKKLQKEQEKKLTEQEKLIQEQEKQLDESNSAILNLNNQMDELEKSLKKSQTRNVLTEIKIGAISFGIGAAAGAAAIIIYNVTR